MTLLFPRKIVFRQLKTQDELIAWMQNKEDDEYGRGEACLHHSDMSEPLISLTGALGKNETLFGDLCRACALAGLSRDS